MIVWAFCAVAAGKSATIVYINGAKYYIHTVQAGETLYGLSKTYGVGEKVILENNPSIARGLKTAENIKIPFVADVPEPKSDKKLRKTFDFHFVSKGETLYAISRQYEIPVKTLLEDNPNLDPLHMRLGERILIRRKQIGSEDEAGTKEQWEEYRQSLNSVAEEGTAYHIVHPGETFYSLSRRFGITEAEFSALNGGLKPADLKAGAMVKIPAPEAGQIPEAPTASNGRTACRRPGSRSCRSTSGRSGPATRSTWRCCCPSPRAASLTATTWSSIRVSCWGWTA